MSRAERITLRVGAAILTTGLVGATLLISAGRWDLPWMWVYLGGLGLITLVGFLGIDAGLFKERWRPGPGGHDGWILPVAKLLAAGHLVLAGVDVGRMHWSGSMPVALQVAFLLLAAGGLSVVIWSMLVNRFFSAVIRLQTERGHELITTGPYRVVRHPGYAGVLLAMLASGPALGSWPSILPMLPVAVLILRRARLEDRFLLDHLQGYLTYADRVRWRLLPGIW